LGETQGARILRCVLVNMSDSALTQFMGISRGTLRTYLGRMFDRFGTRTRGGLVLIATDILNTDLEQRAPNPVSPPPQAKPIALPPGSQ
jgi:DNA-binding CsgD family transcriptional regulator